VLVTFRKLDEGRLCRWDAVRGKRTRVPGTTMPPGRHLPHDLSTFVVESELGLADGFWGCVADGATFRSLPRRRTEQGRRVIREHVAELEAAEVLVGADVTAWVAGGRPATAGALDAMLARWQALPPGGELVLRWPQEAGRARGQGARRPG
jgi:hypothetical protein